MLARPFIGVACAVVLLAGVRAVAGPPPADDAAPIRVGLLVLEGVYNSELAAPMDIFHHTVFHTKPGMQVFTVGRTRAPVTSFEGLRLEVDHDLESAPPIDVLVVPSAEHNMDDDLEDERLIAWVRERGRAARHVVSVCDGAFVLAAAGLLDGRFCTTFPGDIAALRERFDALRVVQGVTFVADGPAVTGVGGARSYEPALYLVEHLYGSEVARGVARGMALRWDLEKERHLVLPDRRTGNDRPACYLPGQRLDPAIVVEDAEGRPRALGAVVRETGARAVVLCVLSGAEAEDVARRGGLWCEDSFSELANLRHLRLRYADRGVRFIAVACPPVHHEATFGYEPGAFLGRRPDDPVYLRNRRRFVEATRALEQRGVLPFDVVVYDPRFRLLRRGDDAVESWEGRLRWFADTQTYGTPTTWVLTADLEVLGPPFVMNVYEGPAPKLRYTAEDVAAMIDLCLAR